jgi:hypothetical protein
MNKPPKTDWLPWIWLILFLLVFFLMGCSNRGYLLKNPEPFSEEDKYWHYF